MKITATAERSGGWWAVEVPDVAGGIHTQARRLDQIPDMVADAAALVLDVDAEDIEVTVTPRLPESTAAVVADAHRQAAEAREAQETASALMRAAVVALRESEHLTTRDAASVLGVSYQRIAQLEKV